MSKKLPGDIAKIIKRWLEESNSADEFASIFTEDAVYQFGNADPIIGRSGIRDSSVVFRQKVKAVAHNIKSIWETGDTAICEMDVTYTRHDGKVFTLPCTDVIRMEGDLIRQLNIYMDITPVFAA